MRSDSPSATDDSPPGPDGLPAVGNHLAFVREPFDFTTRNAREYGDVVAREEIDGPVYQLNHPDHIEQVPVQNNQRYVRRASFQRTLGPGTGNGILNGEGAVWRRNRHLIQPAFSPDRIGEYARMMTWYAEAAASWTDGETRPFHANVMELTLNDSRSRAVRRRHRRPRRGEEVSAALETFMEATESLSNFALPTSVPPPSRRRVKRVRERLDRIVYDMIDRRRANPEGGVSSMLVDATDDRGGSLPDEQIRDEVVTLLLAAIYRQWHLELPPGTNLDLTSSHGAPKREVPVTVHRR